MEKGRRKKKTEETKAIDKEPQGKNIMACPVP